MPCWICSYGDGLDNGICPRCADQGYEEQCVHGCYTDPEGVFRECSRHEGTAAEKAHEQYLEAFYGGSTPMTMQEQADAAAAAEKRRRT